MNRRDVLKIVPAVALIYRGCPLNMLGVCQAPAPSTSPDAIKIFDLVFTFDNAYPLLKSATLKFNDAQKAQVTEACNRWKAVWATDDFRTAVLNSRFQHTGDTPKQIYKNIMAANPKHINYALTAENDGSETAATDVPRSITLLQQRWLADVESTPNRLVNTVCHEYTHTKEGGAYTHVHYQLLFEKRAVPILIGDITEQIADKMFPALVKNE